MSDAVDCESLKKANVCLLSMSMAEEERKEEKKWKRANIYVGEQRASLAGFTLNTATADGRGF